MRTLFASIVLAGLSSPSFAAGDTLATPSDVVDSASATAWIRIAPDDLMVMDLQSGAGGQKRRVVIQLIPAPFSAGWVGNIRKLIAARWYDGIAVVRVQDNYVVQWGDPDGEVPGKAKPLPRSLVKVGEAEYVAAAAAVGPLDARLADRRDAYAGTTGFKAGWPVASDGRSTWPVHCYGMVGVGRNLSPDTGTGAELYTVIGQAPRQLDRNIAVVGRVIAGMEHLSSLPRGTGALGFYETAQERSPITSVRLGNDVAHLPAYEYLSTRSPSFAAYLDKRANRKDDFYIQPAGGVDICNAPVPIREVKTR